MGALVMLFMLVIVVAATATVVTLVVVKAVNANSRRAYLPPAPPPGTTADFDRPQPLQPGPQFPRYPADRLSAGDRERIMVLLRRGKKIHAVKLYRDATGVGLREAKEAVDHLERYQ